MDTESSGPQLTYEKFLNVSLSELTGFSFSFTDEYSCYVPLLHTKGTNVAYTKGLQILDEVLRGNTPTWFWNAKHDLHALARNYKKEITCPVRCGMVLAHTVNRGAPVKKAFSLKPQALHFLGVEMPDFLDTLGGVPCFRDLDPVDALAYAADDALYTMKLCKLHYPYLVGKLHNAFDMEMNLLPVLVYMEKCGIALDKTKLLALSRELEERVSTIIQEWMVYFPLVSIASTQQISRHFYPEIWDPTGLDVGKVGLTTTNGDALRAQVALLPESHIGYKAANLLLEYKELTKNLNTYTHGIVEKADQTIDGRLHATFHQHRTRTYRLSCSGPSIHQIPKRTALGRRVRECFVAEPGYKLIRADYSQIELRFMAHMAGEGNMAEAFREGRDIHQTTADLVSSDRDTGKTLMFSLVYGSGAKKQAKLIGCSVPEARMFAKKLKSAYPEVARLKKEVLEAAAERGYVSSMSGHRRYTPLIAAGRRHPDLWAEERAAFNMPVQGGAADVIKLGTISFYEELKKQGALGAVKLVVQVHDENISEARTEDAEDVSRLLQKSMEEAVKLIVPLIAEPSICNNWSEAK